MAFDPNDPDTKAALAAAVKEAVTAAEDGLKSKNSEIMDELKRAKADLRKTQDINPADLEKLEADLDKARADLAAANKTAKEATTTAEKATKALEAESGFTHKLLVENGLREQLVAAGVTNAALQKGAITMLASQVQVAADGDARVAKVGDKTLTDFVKEWAGSEEGKHYVQAPGNSGGGAPGGKGGESAKSVTRSQFEAMDAGARMAFSKEGGKVTDAVA